MVKKDHNPADCRQVCCNSRTGVLGCISDINHVIENVDATLAEVEAGQIHLGHLMAHVQTLQAHFQEWKEELRRAERDKQRALGTTLPADEPVQMEIPIAERDGGSS